MQAAQFTYAALLLGTIAIPLALSFDRKVHFYTHWKYLFPAILVSAAVFLMWDVHFTDAGIWSFNPDYVTGYGYLGLPVEEWLFFLCIPYASLFIYEVMKAYLPRLEMPNLMLALSLFIIAGSAAISYFHRAQLYTFFNFLFLAIYLGYTIFRNRFKAHLTKFYLCFLIGLLPFLIVNGILTGLPVVEYHPEHILGLRIFHIPVEDFGYFFLLLLMNTTIYETLKEGKYY
ncbi:lycopene cyclase domain-containing protein [Mangrovibacterium marinum]|uniref:Lycopene cyclase domain-containing protein n=1 Tax=Mangrovibacterium marinum TaxID=1639118 RepID=A0A2T5BYQ3_9BACT|nr:lycopene cyclase domain-containing protein [Mangrovibacterium marinum]PTN07379.1 lycopene cyclase domain-containing protein [Mangrovibacterium marinum]